MAKISSIKFYKIYKRAILQNPCWKIFVVESVFDKIAGINSSSCRCIRIFSPSSERSNMNSVFGKTVGYVLQPRNVIKTMVHHKLFYQSIPRTKNSFSYSKNKILVILMPMPTLMPMMMPRSRCGDFQMTKVYLLFKNFKRE